MALGLTNPDKGLLYILINVLVFSISFLKLSQITFLPKNPFMIIDFNGILLYFDMMTKIIAWVTPIFGEDTGF